ncbi:MAG: beta-lactamase family protein [Sneathiellales bacterium]|nr:beta-lactamase family protein [Sneathiellales bacterium]
MMMKKILCYALVLLGMTTGAFAESTDPAHAKKSETLEDLSARITHIMETATLEGAAVALVNRDGVFWTKGFGYADREAGIKVTPETLFRAGSTGKSITSLIAMRLVEEGRLDLSARLHDVAPEVAFTNKWEDEKPVRLVHLLEHTTGWDDFQLSEYRSVAEGTSLAEGLGINPQSRTSRWPPGYYPAYSNSGPAVMGYVLEKVTGEEFNALAQKYVFEPLAIEKATFDQTEEDFSQLAKSYTIEGTPIENTRIWANASGAGAMSVKGLGRIAQLYIRRGEVDGVRLLSPESISRSETPKTTLASAKGLSSGYGLGNYASFDWKNKIVYHGHDGGLNGFLAVYGYQKETGFGFAILINSQNPSGMYQIQQAVQNYLYSVSSVPFEPSTVNDPDLKAYEGLYQAFTPRSESARFLVEAFSLITVKNEGNHLSISGLFGEEAARLASFGKGQFAPFGFPEADRIFYKNEKGQYELSMSHNVSGSAYRKVSPVRAYGPIAIIAFFSFNAVLAILFALVWGIGRSFGKFRNSHRWRVWNFPMLSILAFIAGNLIAAVPTFLTPNAYEILGAGNLVTWAILTSGILVPLFAVPAVIMLFRAKDVSRWARWHAGVATLSLVMLSAMLFYYDLIGLPTWAYTPVTYERYVAF